MDSRTVAHALAEIATLLELRGENRYKQRAYASASRAILGLDAPDIAPLYRAGDIERLAGIGPATLSIVAHLVETGDSEYLEQLRENTPEGLLEMLRVPGLGPAKIHQIHEGLGLETLHELEAAARDGRLAGLPRFGPKTAEKILKGIAFLRATGARVLYPHADAESQRLLRNVLAHPDVAHAEVAGSLRRHCEVIRDIDIVAACRAAPAAVAASFAHAPGVRDVVGGGGPSLTVRYVDGTMLDLHCVTLDDFAVALWRATGNGAHIAALNDRCLARGWRFEGDQLLDGEGQRIPLGTEAELYARLGLAYVPPELREGRGETDAAAAGSIPHLVTRDDIRGVLHCHSQYSDGGATIAEMAHAAQSRGWSYLGISDHSQSAFYAGGLDRDAILRQHDEIDAVNATMPGFRVLKGIEADILPDGRVDYDVEVLDRFEYVIASIHSRLGMNEAQMTERVVRALDDPHVAILGHPTGRLLLTREPYAIDMQAVIDKAGDVGAAIELNADPHRLDLDWRLLRSAKERGVSIEIGPDAHSAHALDNTAFGVGIARKGWLERDDVLNTRTADQVLEFARRRRAGSDFLHAAPQADGW
jgi:DNA polymerase (family 10)